MTKHYKSPYRQPFLAALAFHLILLGLFLFEIRFATNAPLTPSSPQEMIQATLITAAAPSEAVPTPIQNTPPTPPENQKNPEKITPVKKALLVEEKIMPPEKNIDATPEKLTNTVEIQKETEKAVALEKATQQAQIKKEAEKKAALEKQLQTQIQEQMESEEKQKKEQTHQKQQQKTIEQLLQQDLAESRPSKSTTKTTSKNKATASAAGVDNKEIDHYKSLIISAISHRWIVPENLQKGLACHLLVRVAPGGVVISVKLTHSSGNTALDHSAEAAIYKASPLPTPKESHLFNQFREFNLVVRPEGILTE